MTALGPGIRLTKTGAQALVRYALISGRPVAVLDFEHRYSSVPLTLTRASGALFTDPAEVLRTATLDVPRFDWSSGRRALLLEPSATNLLLYSQNFSQGAWTKSAATLTADATTAPDGTTTAAKLVEDSATTRHYIAQTVTVSADATVTYSFYAKAGERTWFVLRTVGTDSVERYSYFDLANGVTGSTISSGHTASIEDAGNGWYRCVVFAEQAAATGNFSVRVATGNSSSSSSYTGDGTSGLYIWGAQLEVGTGPTSYIPTTTATVTRAADLASLTLGAGRYDRRLITATGTTDTPGMVHPGGAISLPAGLIHRLAYYPPGTL